METGLTFTFTIGQRFMYPLLEERSRQIPGEIVLASSEQYMHFWFCGMTNFELENWWVSQESLESTPPLEILKVLCEFFNEPVPPERRIIVPGHFFDVTSEEEADLWMALSDGHIHYKCWMWSDDESFLERPDGTRLYHAGHRKFNSNQGA